MAREGSISCTEASAASSLVTFHLLLLIFLFPMSPEAPELSSAFSQAASVLLLPSSSLGPQLHAQGQSTYHHEAFPTRTPYHKTPSLAESLVLQLP